MGWWHWWCRESSDYHADVTTGEKITEPRVLEACSLLLVFAVSYFISFLFYLSWMNCYRLCHHAKLGRWSYTELGLGDGSNGWFLHIPTHCLCINIDSTTSIYCCYAWLKYESSSILVLGIVVRILQVWIYKRKLLFSNLIIMILGFVPGIYMKFRI